MDLLDQQLSTQVYHFVTNIIGSEDVVKTRRQLFTGLDIIGNGSKTTFISSGSKAEGLDLNTSDVDLMYVWKGVDVFETHDTLQSANLGFKLTMDISMTKPGFTLLKILISRQNELKSWKRLFPGGIKTCENGLYFSSKCFREKFLDSFKRSRTNQNNTIIHGPCVSTSDGRFDFAACFRCHKWVSPAHSWINRTRNSWPKNELMRRIIDYGVLFVPIGCKGSSNEHLEWRISFSVAEKQLIHSFNHVQFLCYALLKIILVDFIKPKHGDLICSYFLKTIMFWLCEEHDQYRWKPYNFLFCFITCLKRLLYCVEYETLLHYFIPDNNFFENRFTAVQHTELLETLTSIYNLGWRCILYTDNFKKFNSVIPNNSLNCLQASSIGLIQFVNVSLQGVDFKTAISRLSFSSLNIAIQDYLLSLCCKSVSKNMQLDINTTCNKLFLKQYKKCRAFLLKGLNTDAVSGWLLLALFYYKCKQYRQCIYITDYCISKCTPDKILLSSNPDIESQSIFENLLGLLGRRQYFTIVKHCILNIVTFEISSTIIPIELKYYIDTERCQYFPPVVFAYFLKFLCCHHLHDRRGKQLTFHELELVVDEKYFILDGLEDNSHICLDIAKSLK